MAQRTLNNGETGLTIRGKINDNFTELYDGLELKADDADLSTLAARVSTIGAGWSPNASDGDKTVSVADWDASTHNPTGSDTVSQVVLQAVIDHLTSLTKKVQALQAAERDNLRPNA